MQFLPYQWFKIFQFQETELELAHPVLLKTRKLNIFESRGLMALTI